MATNSIGGLRRSSRCKKRPLWFHLAKFNAISKKKNPEDISAQNLRRSTRLKNTNCDEKLNGAVKESAQKGKISSVEQLLETGFFEGVPVTCFSEELGVDVPGVIKGSGFLCGCSQCNYNSKSLSGKEFEKHAGANNDFQMDHIFFSNGINLYEVFQVLRNIPEDDFYVKILKLRGDLEYEQLSEESPQGTTTSITGESYESIHSSNGETLHELSLEQPDVPRSSSVAFSSRPGKHGQKKHHKQITKPLRNTTKGIISQVRKDFNIVSTRNRLKHVLQSHKGVLVRCTICRERSASLGDEADPKLIIFCNQCNRASHVGCLEDQESFEMDDVFNGNWFCCADCIWVHKCLINICALGSKQVPVPFLNLLKRPQAAENNHVNLVWQIFGGGNTKDRVLLSQSLKLIKGAFKQILHGKKDMIREMVYGFVSCSHMVRRAWVRTSSRKQVAGTGQDFRGMLCILIKHDDVIISIAVLRVLGKCIAELPLVTSSKLWRLKGYFGVLLSLIEELLHLLQVRLLVAPVHGDMQSIWIHKFGFVKASDQKVQMLKEQHGLVLFEDTALLEKDIRGSCD